MEKKIMKDEYKFQFVNSLTARERFDILKTHKMDIKVIDKKYIESWQSRKNLADKDSFLMKLKIEKFTENDFNFAIKDLNEEEKKLIFDHLEKMEWYERFKAILEFFYDFKDENKENLQYDISYPVSPFIYWASSNIEECTRKLKNIELSDSAFGEIMQALFFTLINIVQKSITMELHITKKKKTLKGDTPEERFQTFIKENFDSIDSLLRFYAKYAALARILTVKTSYFVENLTKAITRLDQNADLIKEILHIDIFNKSIQSMKCNEGDSHQKGNAVIQFIFENNTIIIYKPRNLEITKKYHEFIKWFNEKSGLLPLPVNQGVYRQDYTFETFIDYKSCNSQEEVKDYYIRFGQIIAIMHILCGNDFHLENIIANGSYPNIIDLETLFQQIIPLEFMDRADVSARKDIVDSVINTGLLPFIAFSNNLEGKGIDISGLNGGDQKLPFKVLLPSNLYTDEMKYEYQDYVRIGSNNLPMLKNEKVKFTKYSKYIIEGFQKTSNFIIENKNLFLGKEGIFQMFQGTLVRQIMKSTQRYVVMLDFSYHPNCTQSFLEREKLFENLWGYPYKNKEIIKHEIDDMYFDDVPIFFTYPDSRDLITSKGVIIKDYFEESSLSRAMTRIKNLDKAEVDKQVSYMIISFGEYGNVSKQILETKNKKFAKNILQETSHNEINLLDESCKIADEILKQAIYSNDKQTITWSDVIQNKSGVWEPADVDESLYSGLAGISLYFHQLYKLTSRLIYKETSEKALSLAIVKSRYVTELNSYKGRGSLLLPLLILYKDTKKELYQTDIEEIIAYIDENLEQIEHADWSTGIAGLIQNILNAYDLFEKESYLNLAEKIGSNLITKLSLISDTALFSEMDYEVGEICFSLFKLSFYTKNKSFKKKAIELLNYQRNSFEKEKKFKADLGMTRFMMLDFYKDDKMLSEIELISTSLCEEMKENDTLNNGNFKDIEFLLYYYELTNKRETLEIIHKKLENIFSYREFTKEFRIPTIPSFIPVGLLTGLSGIGYELLRLYAPEKVQSVLILSINNEEVSQYN
ncbi:type 2 lanthipeptide synthetase LanM family protein [Anaerosacchariphilus polymeriproducens]|uniref:Type 2 lantipeptide synthetase LanM n=1 Tax=Anaerosacchariphilus polymeriproducens TaxID=1812858 RepID=A0A371AWI7_9FIRM|nr:type 2 lanthipeptide synthetase LanM family protein [Anaerosacchariphilus polymeriproducens]RDU23830.1 type 2 lantipeptide synthetase LanM [Anaerosacchariphilus polymeriproducens]